MNSQVEKFNRRKQKTEELRTNRQENKKSDVKETVSENKQTEEKVSGSWNEKLLSNEYWQLYQKLSGASIAITANSEDGYKASLNAAQDYLKGLSEEELQQLSPEEQNRIDALKQSAPVAHTEENKGNENLSDKAAEQEAPEAAAPASEKPKEDENTTEPQTLQVGIIDQSPENTDWIAEKRAFWKEYAQSIDNSFENDPAKDGESKSFSCALSKSETRGEIRYSSPTAVQISKESHLELYQGLVRDALKNNLSITFGYSLDDKQKAMLLAACLKEQKLNAEDGKVAMLNVPQINPEAAYFKELPEDVQKTLGKYITKQKEQAKQEENQKKLEELRGRLKKNETEGKTTDLPDDRRQQLIAEREALRREQITAIKESMPADKFAKHQKNEEEHEKILAARLGITPAYTTKDLKGNERVVERDPKTEKSNRFSQELRDALRKKYGNEGK